jgi:acetoacetate decarboxylase
MVSEKELAMEQPGRLKRENFGYSMPVDAPLYPKPPIYYRNAEAISVLYETDGVAAAEMVPEGLVVPSPAVAVASVFTYPLSTLGMYNEAILSISVLRDGTRGVYIAHILVDNDQAMTAGREIWGYPKKLAHITFERRGEGIVGTVERPAGNRLCTVVVQPETPMEVGPAGPGFSLRVLPSLREDGAPESAQLVETRTTDTVHSQWAGRGSLSFGAVSDIDPWSRLPVKKLIGGVHRHYDMVLPLGRVVREY